MLAIHDRLAELWIIQKKRPLTPAEMADFHDCLEANAAFARKMARLENLSSMAFSTDDWDWLHRICKEIEELELTYKQKTPGYKSTDGK